MSEYTVTCSKKTCGFNRICHLLFHGLSFWQAQTEDTEVLFVACVYCIICINI